MKKRHISWAIAILIAGVLIWQVIDKRAAFQCYVLQQASLYKQVYDQGLATRHEIHELVWNDTVADFKGQDWRAALDRVYHELFLGGSRARQVMAELHDPADHPADLICGGYILWTIRDVRDSSVWQSFHEFDIESMRDLTAALDLIPPDELRHYKITVQVTTARLIRDDFGGISVSRTRDGGEVSADEWLRGNYVPEYWSGWYAAWLERDRESQSIDDN